MHPVSMNLPPGAAVEIRFDPLIRFAGVNVTGFDMPVKIG